MKTFGVTDYTNLVHLKCCGRMDGRSGPTTRPAFAKGTQVTNLNVLKFETLQDIYRLQQLSLFLCEAGKTSPIASI